MVGICLTHWDLVPDHIKGRVAGERVGRRVPAETRELAIQHAAIAGAEAPAEQENQPREWPR
jgi:hypothetical protein